MPKKPIEEHTDKELEKLIESHEREFRKYKETEPHLINNNFIKNMEAKQKILEELLEERRRRKEKGSYFPKS